MSARKKKQSAKRALDRQVSGVYADDLRGLHQSGVSRLLTMSVRLRVGSSARNSYPYVLLEKYGIAYLARRAEVKDGASMKKVDDHIPEWQTKGQIHVSCREFRRVDKESYALLLTVANGSRLAVNKIERQPSAVSG